MNRYSSIAQITLLCMGQLAFAGPVEWANPQYGLWGEATNWSTGLVPELGDHLVLGHTTPYTVFLQSQYEAASLSINNPSARVELLGNASLSLVGDLHNAGLISVNPKRSLDPTMLRFIGDSILTGNGTLQLHQGAIEHTVLEVAIGETLTNAVGHTVEGDGRMTGRFENNGQFIASTANSELVFVDGHMLNHSTLAAHTRSSLVIDNVILTQGELGSLLAAGPGSEVRLLGSDIDRGQLSSALGGRVVISTSGSTLRGSRITGNFDIELGQGTETTLHNTQLENVNLKIVSTTGSNRRVVNMLDGTVLTGTGTIRLEAQEGTSLRPQLNFDESSSIVGNYPISGYGTIMGDYENRLGIIANVAGEELAFIGDIESTASIVAQSGAMLTLEGDIQQLKGSSILAANAGTVLKLAGSVEGGTITSVFGAQIETDSLTLIDTLLNAQITGGLSIRGLISNHGLIKGGVYGSDNTTLMGPGAVELTGGLGSSKSSTFVHAADHTIYGTDVWSGVNANLINYGLIRMIGSDARMWFTDGSVHNEALIEAVDGSEFAITVPFTQSDEGVLRVDGEGGLLRVEVGASFIGGTIQVTSGAEMIIYFATNFSDLHFDGYATIDSGGSFIVNDGLILDGTIVIEESHANPGIGSIVLLNGDLLEGACTFRFIDPEGDGAFHVGSGDIDKIRIGAGHRIEGDGRTLANIEMNGALAPGYPLGSFHLSQFFEFTPSGRLEIELAPESGDSLNSTAQLMLAGTLDVRFVEGFTPSGAWVRSIVTADSIDGAFDSVLAPDAPDGLVTRIYNTGTELLVGQVCPGDIDLNGVLDFFDVSGFLDAFVAQSPTADLDGNGIFDFFDVSAFLDGFGAGCPD